jgi:hypothetical protein
MRGLTAVLVAVTLGGCTSVKLSQRDGCWVRHTEGFLRGAKEELGPCARPQPPWVEDRLGRLVQECQARADYRWQSRALAAWSRGERLPEQASDNAILQECMGEATRAMLSENEELKAKMAEAAADRDALRARLEDERRQLQASLDDERRRFQSTLDDERTRFQSTLDDERIHLHATNEKLAEYLGEAAKKAQVPAVATATATSDGRARTEQASSPQAPVAVVGAAALPVAACAPDTKAAGARPARVARKGKPVALRAAPPACDPAAETAEAARDAQPGSSSPREAGGGGEGSPEASGTSTLTPPLSRHAGEGDDDK